MSEVIIWLAAYAVMTVLAFFSKEEERTNPYMSYITEINRGAFRFTLFGLFFVSAIIRLVWVMT